MTPQAPFQLHVLILRHPTHGSLWIRRWSAQAAHGLRSRVQLQLLWQPLKEAAYSARWELGGATESAHTVPWTVTAGVTTGRKQAQWSFTLTAAVTHTHFQTGRVLRGIARAGLGRSMQCTTQAGTLAQGQLEILEASETSAATSNAGNVSATPLVTDWTGAQALSWSVSAERMPRSLFLWSHRAGAHGLQLEIAPHVSLAAAVTHATGAQAQGFAQLTLQGPPQRFPFETRFTHPGRDFDLRVIGEGKSTSSFELESPSGLQADTRVSLAPALETLSGISDGVFPDLFDLSLPLPGAHL